MIAWFSFIKFDSRCCHIFYFAAPHLGNSLYLTKYLAKPPAAKNRTNVGDIYETVERRLAQGLIITSLLVFLTLRHFLVT